MPSAKSPSPLRAWPGRPRNLALALALVAAASPLPAAHLKIHGPAKALASCASFQFRATLEPGPGEGPAGAWPADYPVCWEVEDVLGLSGFMAVSGQYFAPLVDYPLTVRVLARDPENLVEPASHDFLVEPGLPLSPGGGFGWDDFGDRKDSPVSAGSAPSTPSTQLDPALASPAGFGPGAPAGPMQPGYAFDSTAGDGPLAGSPQAPAFLEGKAQVSADGAVFRIGTEAFLMITHRETDGGRRLTLRLPGEVLRLARTATGFLGATRLPSGPEEFLVKWSAGSPDPEPFLTQAESFFQRVDAHAESTGALLLLRDLIWAWRNEMDRRQRNGAIPSEGDLRRVQALEALFRADEARQVGLASLGALETLFAAFTPGEWDLTAAGSSCSIVIPLKLAASPARDGKDAKGELPPLTRHL